MSNDSTQANPISEAYNETMHQDGRTKWQEKYKQADNVTEQAPQYSQLKQVLDLVADGLSKDIEEARKGKGRRPTWLNDLMHLDPRQLALIGLQTCYNAVLKDSTLSSVTQEIGSLIDRECLALELLHSDDEEANKNNRRIVKMVSEAHTSAHIRLKALRNIATKNGTKSVYFGIEEKKGDRKMHMKRGHPTPPQFYQLSLSIVMSSKRTRSTPPPRTPLRGFRLLMRPCDRLRKAKSISNGHNRY